ncbi:hypothetical protein D9611_009586 [Ephemerocybe angulata]|uniref:Uncharacterized protein n=1 Tax=Ephemerocybe angulata TaxID=980116 RepID=A0A8H5FGD4_9AGAR|nr:hypothetical protein D9611_009586 [Tulosesus angulatus]
MMLAARRPSHAGKGRRGGGGVGMYTPFIIPGLLTQRYHRAVVLPHKVTKVGLMVAKSITLKARFENLGVHLIQDTAAKANGIAGDCRILAAVVACATYS